MEKEYFGETDIVKIARWENTLNSWEWPKDFPIEKPLGFDALPNYSSDKSIRTKHKIISPIMKDIEDTIGRKETMRWHHLNNLEKTNFQFEVWWLSEKINEFFWWLGFKNFYLDCYKLFGWRER